MTAEELDKARLQFLRGQIQTRHFYGHMGSAEHAVYFDDPNLINTVVDKFDAVTAEQAKAPKVPGPQ